jgi:hypothetical protein
MFILAVVFSMDDDPSMGLFADPWRSRQEGLLTLEACSDYWGCIHEDLQPLHMRKASNTTSPQRDENRYKYRDLKASEIRLLKLSPGSGIDPLEGTIEDVALEEAGSFCALSYVWGIDSTSIAPSYLHTADGVITITASLHSALRSVRDKCLPKRLWIDAVCINQRNLTEKAMQIRLMNSIFRTAEYTIAWLGHNQDRSDQVINNLQRICQDQKTSYWPKYLSDNSKPRITVPSADQGIWSDLDAFLDRGWFKRMWIVQELVLSTKVKLICDESQIDWDDFFGALAICEREINIGVAPDSEDMRILPHASAAYALGVT